MAEGTPFEVRLLGAVEIIGHDGLEARAGSRKQRALLAILAIARGNVVSVERIVDELWGDDPPSQAMASLYPYVSNLRRILEPRRDVPPSTLVTVPPGYALRMPDDALDVVRFERAAREVCTLVDQRHWSQVRERSEVALSWWRGGALEEFASEPFAELEAARLEELRVVMLEDLFEARVEMNDGQATADIERLVGTHPLRERSWGLLMRSLYAGGRQGDALRAYQRARAQLRDELGVEPGSQLREIEASILRHDITLRIAPHERTATSIDVSDAVRAPAAAPAMDPPSGTRGPLASSGLVGRDRELTECRQVLDEVSQGPRAIIIEGEPGIGKTRLVEEVAALAAEREMLVLWGRSLDAATTPAFWPWLPVLRRLAELDVEGPGPSSDLRSLLSPSSTTSTASTFPMGPEPARFSLFDDIVALIERVAHRRHLMIALDDLQWADHASLELVVTLTTRLSRPGVLLAVTTRKLDVGRTTSRVAALAALTRMTGTLRVQLAGLDHAATTELLTLLTGRPVEPETAAAVLSRAEGNAFFTTEMGRLLTGATNDGEALAQVAVTVRDVIVRRLAPMPPATLELLNLASVIGREFSISTVTNAMQFTDVLECLEVLEPAVLQHLVIHIDTNPGTYRFTHGLVSDVLVHDQTAAQLAKTHLRIADALDDSDDMAETLAEHLLAATPLGVGRRAAHQFERAARVAMARGAYEAAQHHLERAVALFQAADPPDTEARDRALTLLTSALVFSRGPLAVEVLELANQRSRIDTDDPARVAIRLLEFHSLHIACDFRSADPIVRELQALAETTSNPLIRSMGYAASGDSCWYYGRFAEATIYLNRAIDALALMDKHVSVAPLDAIQVHMPYVTLAHLRDLMGETDDSESATEMLRNVLDGDRLWNTIVAHFSCFGALMVGEHGRALREAERAIKLDPQRSFGRWSEAIRLCRLVARGANGDLPVARRALEVLGDGYRPGTQRTTMSVVYATLAMTLARSSNYELAADACDRARAEIDPHNDLYTEPLVLAAEATVAAFRPEGVDRASRLLNRALVITERQSAHAVSAHISRVAHTLGHEMATVLEL